MPSQSTYFNGASHFQIDHQTINSIAGSQYFLSGGQDLSLRLNPILDASHTRNRNTSPPDSECFPGTREALIHNITTWGDAAMDSAYTWETEDDWDSVDGRHWAFSDGSGSMVVHRTTPHICWLHGFAGCGKSAISLKVAQIYSGSDRLLASYFFFRGAGDRSTMRRFAVTLASQLAAALPATAPFIEAAVKAEPGLLTSHVSLATQLDRLILSPFQSVINEGGLEETLTKGPFLIVIDGLDECEDKRGVEEFIDHILNFFEEHPTIPLRVFIASRVEQHIRACLETDGVVLGNLDSYSTWGDVEKFLRASFRNAAKKDRIIRAYVRARGAWPTQSDMDKLIGHIGGSFVLASTMFKYIAQPATEKDPTTPMDRLPLTLEMNGLDGLYAQTLARSQNLPHFCNIISTTALLKRPLAIVGISDLLGIEAFEVIRVLLSLQAVIRVPGTDEEGDVTLCHTSLRDFLTTENRSRSFFVPSSFHLHLSFYCFSSAFEKRNGQAYSYGLHYFDDHWRSFADLDACDFINGIKQFKSRRPVFVNRPQYHAFLCSMFFYTIFLKKHWSLTDNSYLLTECTNQLALAAECSDPHIRLWLKQKLLDLRAFGSPVITVEFTEHTYETIRHGLQRASAAIHTNFSETLEHHTTSSGAERTHTESRRLSGIAIFKVHQVLDLGDVKAAQ
ncbi:hypothetical protein H1R20_g4785, partial [Candolleomyces eurysporus]